MNSQPPPPAWYRDPDGTNRRRYWDGNAWTDRYKNLPLTERFAALPTWKRTGILVVIGAAVVGSMAAGELGSDEDRPTSSCDNVVYRVGGTASTVSITMENATGNTEQNDPVTVPYVKMLACIPRGQFVYISAQNNGEQGTVTCEIQREGEIVATSTSSGAFVIASCSD